MKTYIFDLDGTLVNSLYDLADSMNAALEQGGFPTFEIENYKYFVGNGTLKLVERTLPQRYRTEENIAVYHRRFADEYNKRCLNKTLPYEGIIDVLKKLKENGAQLAVASNKPDKFAKFIVEKLFGENFFDIAMGKKDGVPTKPSPDILYDILNKLGAVRSEAIMIGDSDVDVITAHNAGIKCAGVLWGFRNESELNAASADIILEKPEDILKL